MVKMRPLKWALIRSDWCPYEQRCGQAENMPALGAHEGHACDDGAEGTTCLQREKPDASPHPIALRRH